MKNIVVILISMLLAGCPMGDKLPKYSQADAVVVNDKICVFIKKENLVAQEKLLRVSIVKAGDEKMSYERQFYSPVISVDLKSGECINSLSGFNYETGYSYDISVQTPHNNYQTSFILWKYGKSLKLK